jgi:hypothetical protein
MENSTCPDNKDVHTIFENILDKNALHATPLPAKQNTIPCQKQHGALYAY